MTSKKNSKLKRLEKNLASMDSVLIAYSGGVDSTFLLKVASDVLGNKKVLAVTAKSVTFPSWEMQLAKKMAKKFKIKQIIIETDELKNSKFVKNSKDRCYWCKKELFSKLLTIAEKEGLRYVADGANYDDIKDFRPGMKAAKELKVRSPLKEARLKKEEIREMSKNLGLPTWNKPSFACFSSRFPYGVKITKDLLQKINTAESLLRKLGLTQVRVRHHDKIARIEVYEEEIPKLIQRNIREKIVSEFNKLGYLYVTIDLQGYKTGSINKTLNLGRKK
jgi:uncharacterized protein